jgi:hypothetical protein
MMDDSRTEIGSNERKSEYVREELQTRNGKVKSAEGNPSEPSNTDYLHL